VTAAVWLALAGLAAVGFPVARFSRWRWLSPWITVFGLAGGGLLVTSGVVAGNWAACAMGAVTAAVLSWAGRLTARARRRMTEAGRG